MPKVGLLATQSGGFDDISPLKCRLRRKNALLTPLQGMNRGKETCGPNLHFRDDITADNFARLCAVAGGFQMLSAAEALSETSARCPARYSR